MLEALLASDGTPRALVLTGGPGVGKTSLWEAGVEAARDRGLCVLRASGSGAETQLSFAALIDLLDGIDLDVDRRPSASATAGARSGALPGGGGLAAGCIRARPRAAEHTPFACRRPAGPGGGRRPPVARRDLRRCARLRRPAARCGAHRCSCSPGDPDRPPRSSGRSARTWRAPRWGRSRSARCAGCCPSGSGSRCRATSCAASTRRRSATRSSRSRSAGRSRAAGRRRSPRTCRCRRPSRTCSGRGWRSSTRRVRRLMLALALDPDLRVSTARRDRRRGRARGRARRGCGRT